MDAEKYGLVVLRENGHEWFYYRQDKYLSCRKCGLVRRTDGKSRSCAGPVKISLRDSA